MAHGGKYSILAAVSRLTDHIGDVIHYIGVVSCSADHRGQARSTDYSVIASTTNQRIRSQCVATEVRIDLAIFGVEDDHTTTPKIRLGKQYGPISQHFEMSSFFWVFEISRF